MRFLPLLILFLFFRTPATHAQQGMFLQGEPSLSYTWQQRNRWSFNANTAVRYTLAQPGEEGTEGKSEFDFNETQLFATYALWNNTKMSGGYGFRIRSLEDQWFDEHRLMEQLAFVLYARSGKRIANRVRLEQRIRKAGYINRWRYRVGFDSPLNGQRLDPGETYVIVTNEFLWSFNGIEQSGENRLYAGIGWFLNDQYKFETGMQYRVSDIGPNSVNTLWISTVFYINKRQPQKKEEE